MTKTARLLELMMIVYERRKFTVEDMAAEFGVSYRTMLRYLQELSGLGVPLYSETGKGGGYSLLTGVPPRQPRTSASPSPALLRRLFRPSSRIIGLELQAPFAAVYLSNSLIPQLWDELSRRLGELRLPPGPCVFTGAAANRSRIYRYIAGAEVSADAPVPEGMTSLELPSKAYAVYRHHGLYSREERDETYFQALERLRLENRDHDPDAFCLEIYAPAENTDSLHSRMECEVFIPLSSPGKT
jgi:predicted transcriptional regulator YdeE